MDGKDAIKYIISNNIEGCIVECGVDSGRMEKIFIEELKNHKQVRDIYMFDTFSGLTEPGVNDYAAENGPQQYNTVELLYNEWKNKQIDNNTNGWCYTPLQQVNDNLKSTGYPSNKLFYIVGDVRKTLNNNNNIPEKIAILRLDTDWYDSSKIELEKLFPNVVEGGIVIFDDYFFWNGQKVATDEYFSEINETYDFVKINNQTAAIFKKKKNVYTDHFSYLQVYNYPNKIRLGNNFDGGYVIANIGDYDFYISAGIGGDESFSSQIFNKFNIQNGVGFQFDIQKLPDNYPRKMTFIKKNISYISDNNLDNLQSYMNQYNNIFLKMDIEGDEFPWLNSVTTDNLNKIKQFVCEFHAINDDTWNNSFSLKLSCFKKLAETHYLVHAHGNNYAPTQNINGYQYPYVIELTYIRKKDLKFELYPNSFPLPLDNLDYPNNNHVHDLNMNFPPFVNKA
jgi:hypothetical protein